jgi:hypothetical protein
MIDMIILGFIILGVLLFIGLTIRTFRERRHWPGSA